MQKLSPIRMLRYKWWLVAIFGVTLWLGFFSWLRTWWPAPFPQRWVLISGLALVYFLWVILSGLKDNHRPGEAELLTTIGLGNLFSIGRGFIMVLFVGFLFSPWPDFTWTPWLPGMLYTLAALPDFVDGVAARLTDHVTKLGETLDMSIDSLGVLGVSILSVQYGQVPWWYLSVGLARYIFVFGIWIRKRLQLPVYGLPFSVRRRGYAALTMGLFFAILYPIFEPPGTHLAAGIFASYLLVGFGWDWLLTIGQLPHQPGKNYLAVEKIIVQYVPLLFRSALILWGVVVFLPVFLSPSRSPLLWAEAIAILCLICGIAGRITAIAALVILGLHQASAPLDAIQMALIVIHTNLLFLGTGAYSLWPVENHLIDHRIGDPR